MITADELIQLREKVKNEIDRRCSFNGYGRNLLNPSLYEWGTEGQPVQGGMVYGSQGKTVVDSLLTIADIGNLRNVQPNEPIPDSFDNDTLSGIVDLLAEEGQHDENSSCRGACTGLCVGTCAGDCTSGCVSDCTGGCGSTCTGTCGGDCTGACSGVCTSCSSECGS